MLEYQIALINVFWSENDINVRYFDNKNDQEEYFNLLTEGKYSSLVNFNMSNNVETEITYRDNSGRDIDTLLSSNYAVVKRIKDDDVSYRYFFAYAKQDSGNQLRVTLSLDDFQTNYITYKHNITPCMIKRCCLNRFKEENNQIIFDSTLQSKLFEEEDIINTSKRLTKRTKLNINQNGNKSFTPIFNNWLNENVLGWFYCFLDSTHIFKFYDSENKEVTESILLPLSYRVINNQSSNLYCVCVPVYKSSKRIIITEKSASLNKWKLDLETLRDFLKNNNDFNYCFSYKFIPFLSDNNSLYDDLVTFDEQGNANLFASWEGNNLNSILGRLGSVKSTSKECVVLCDIQENSEINIKYTIEDLELTFDKNEIINSNKSFKFNPKLLNEKYRSIGISDGVGVSFEYSIQKLNKKDIDILYTEAIVPDMSRRYIRIKDNGYYIEALSYNGCGYTNIDDTSTNLVSSAFQTMLANNKNYFLQNIINKTSQTINNLGSTMALSGNLPLSGVQALSGGVELATYSINQMLNIDNVKNAPGNASNLKGNIINQLMYSPPGCYVEEYSIIDNEKEIINDYMNEYGFTYNQTDLLSNVDNIRKYFNYVEAEVETINAPISNIEKERLKQRLKSVRMWNSDNISYVKENYERWLENG